MAHAKRNIEESPVAPGAPREAPGVVYASDTAAPGLKMFRCEPYRANLTMKGCASRWCEAQTARGELADRLEACRGCAIGAAHAGHATVTYSRWYGLTICPRCDRGTTRMIGNRRCVSCYNREREMRAGKNARGNRPVELLERPLHAVELRLVVDDEPRRLRDRSTTGVQETMIQALRTTRGEICFGFVGPERLLRQGRLF